VLLLLFVVEFELSVKRLAALPTASDMSGMFSNVTLGFFCPAQISGKTFVFEEKLDNRPVDGRGVERAEHDDRSGNLAQTEGLDGLGEGVGGVNSSRVDLSDQLPIGKLFGVEDVFGLVCGSLSKDVGVEDVVVAEVGVEPAHACIVLEDVVAVELVEGEEGGVGAGVGRQSLLEHDLCEGLVEAECRVQGVHDLAFGEVLAVVSEEAMVGQRVHHRAWAAKDFEATWCPFIDGTLCMAIPREPYDQDGTGVAELHPCCAALVGCWGANDNLINGEQRCLKDHGSESSHPSPFSGTSVGYQQYIYIFGRDGAQAGLARAALSHATMETSYRTYLLSPR